MKLQEEHREWLERMFRGQDPTFPAAGLVEESAELLHALLKFAQRGVWGDEERYRDTDWNAKMVDAVGDCAIYACSYCNAAGWDFEPFYGAIPAGGAEVPLSRAVELVALAANFTSAQSKDGLELYMSELKGLASALRIDFDSAVATTWAEVKGRKR